jgi:hypothetical protein
LVLTFTAPTNEYVITFPPNPNGTMSVALTQEPAVVDIGVGLAVVQGTVANSVVLPFDETARLLGITIHNTKTDITTGVPSALNVVTPGNHVSVLRDGVVAVRATEGVTEGAAVFVVFQNGTAAAPLGSLSGTDTADTTALGSSYWRSSTTAAGTAELVVKLP